MCVKILIKGENECAMWLEWHQTFSPVYMIRGSTLNTCGTEISEKNERGKKSLSLTTQCSDFDKKALELIKKIYKSQTKFPEPTMLIKKTDFKKLHLDSNLQFADIKIED